jgi:dUTP pyrophosphatase
MKLFLQPLCDFAKQHYQEDNVSRQERGDAGYDLFSVCELVVEPFAVVKIPLGVACAPDDTNYHGYYLYPRSSISKTPLMMANSVGIIDAGYRGEICAMVRNCSQNSHIIRKGDKLFQLCAPDLKPINMTITDTLSDTVRGEGGFGSTGLNLES